jgi:preprotein translocase subunit SecG
MDFLRILLTVIFAIDCIAMTVVVLMQQGKNAGLGALAGGSSETYWGKNKGRSKEGTMAKLTKIFAVVFFVLGLVLNLNF